MKKIISLLSGSLLLIPALVFANGSDTTGHMMDWGWGGGMMGGSWGIFMFLTWLVWLVAGVLVVVWLWQQINKK